MFRNWDELTDEEKKEYCKRKAMETGTRKARSSSESRSWFCCGVKWPWSRLHCQCGEHRPE